MCAQNADKDCPIEMLVDFRKSRFLFAQLRLAATWAPDQVARQGELSF